MRRIKVLHLTTHLNIGGITTYIHLLGKGLINKGFEFHVISSGGELVEQFQRDGFCVHTLKIKTKSELSPKIYWNVPMLVKYIKNNQIDLIHAHTRVTQVMAWWVSKLTGVPFMTTSHGFYKNRIGRRLMPCWGELAVAISPPVADWLVQGMKVQKDKVKTILNAIDIDALERNSLTKNSQDILAEWKISTTTPIIGMVARIVEDKGHEYLVRALSALKEKYPDIKLVIAGEGPFKNKICRLTKSLHLQESVRFVGNLNDVTKALSVIDIFVLPAIWREGFGLSIIEAMALKKPVIVTNIWALNALIHDRVDGFLIEPKNVKAIVDAVDEMIANPTLRNKIAIEAYNTVKSQFSIHRMAGEFEAVYRSLVQCTQMRHPSTP